LKSLRDLYLGYLEQARSSTASRAKQRVDVLGITQTIKGALASAGLDTQSGVGRSVTQTIEQALASAGLGVPGSADPAHAATLEGVAHDVTASTGVAGDDALIGPAVPDEPARPGDFVTRTFGHRAETRTYKLYVPASYSPASEERVPLVVMLHGCTQDPDDFAAGTRMNTLADEHGFIVVYPAQEPRANGSKCWNWFRAQDQTRDRGEPAQIAGITREVAAGYRIDERRIFVAGLSAGAAMAVILAATYPDLYAAVGVHSGLPYGAAHDVPSAFAAMKNGNPGRSPLSPDAGEDPRSGAGPAIPTIIFHGDHDATVSASNADAIVRQARAGRADNGVLQSTVSRGTSPNGQADTRTVLADGARQPVIEYWALHGAGHAWSGGSAGGSFTDPNGPDASAEMIRFFYSQHRGGSA
jgi:poly(hydroxyalkanoate) depolymerase family esterase